MSKKNLTLEYLKEIETNDSIDWDCFHDVFNLDDNDSNEYPDIMIIRGDGNWERDVNRIKIDNAIEILQELKKEGCNYTEIMYHCDHNSYVFNGILARESTPEEIERNELKKKRDIERQQEILKHQAAINSIINDNKFNME